MRIIPKKSLGQNFLTDQNIQKKIVKHCSLGADDIVLEIGSGTGILTKLLAQSAKKVFAFEIDAKLCAHLKEELSDNRNVKVINQDFLQADLSAIFNSSDKKAKVIGNIPYYISSPIIERLIDYRDNFDFAFLTVQREFAERVVAAHGSKDYSSLSCFVQYHMLARILFPIKRTSFYPAPKVDSCFLQLTPRKGGFTPKPLDEKLFFRIIRGAFNKRRKILKNSLEGIIPESQLERFFAKYKVSKNVRPEELSLEAFVALSNA